MAAFGVVFAAAALPEAVPAAGAAAVADQPLLTAELALTAEGEVELQINLSPSQATRKVGDKQESIPAHEFRLLIDGEELRSSRDRSRQNVRHTLWFPLTGHEAGRSYQGVKLVQGGQEMLVQPFVIPGAAEGEPEPGAGALIIRVPLPPELDDPHGLELLLEEGPPLEIMDVENGEALFDAESLKSLRLASTVRLRSKSGQEWTVRGRRGAGSMLAVVFAVLWLATAGIWWYRHRSSPEEKPEPAVLVERIALDTRPEENQAPAPSDEFVAEDPEVASPAAPAEHGTGAVGQAVAPMPVRKISPTPTPLPERAVGGSKRLARVAAEWWRDGDSDLDRLSAIAEKESLHLYEWLRFSDVLRTIAPGSTPLYFSRWHRHGTGPVFLGWKERQDLYLVPVNLEVFDSDQGLSALRALFELTPPPARKEFLLRTVRRACHLSPRADHYRLQERGVLETAPLGATTVADVEESAPVAVAVPPPDLPTVTGPYQLADLRAVVHDELRPIAAALSTLESDGAERRRLLVGIDMATRSLRPRDTSEAAELRTIIRDAVWQAIASAGARGDHLTGTPWTEVPERPEKVPATPALIAGIQSPEVPAIPDGPDPAPVAMTTDFRWLADTLSYLEIGPAGSAVDYVRALRRMKDDLQYRETSQPPVRMAYCRVSFDDPDRCKLQEVHLALDTGDPKFRKKDASWITSEAVWQVFIAAVAPGEGTGPGPVAVAFPWSRLEKGAPMIARHLVDTSRSGATGDIVRCLEPAVLVPRDDGDEYIVAKKMVVAPLDISRRA